MAEKNDFDTDPIKREEDGYNTSAKWVDPAGQLGIDPDGLSSPGPDPYEGMIVSDVVAHQDELVSEEDTKGSPLALTRKQLIWRRFIRSKTSLVGMAIFIFVVVFALVGPFIGKWEYTDVDKTAFLKPPNSTHWFGTGQTGRDLFALVVEGLRKSIVIGLAVAAIQTVVAALVGASAAFFGRYYDKVVLWIIDLLLVIPSFLLIAIITQKVGGSQSSTWILILLLAAFGWMLTARVVRSMTLSVINLDYVRAARYMSVPSFATITRHIIPNVSSFLIIDFTLGVVGAVLAETTLSFFGFGVQSPETSLGVLLSEGQSMATSFPWVFLAPATFLTLLLVSVNFMGDGLRDAIDPTSNAGGKA